MFRPFLLSFSLFFSSVAMAWPPIDDPCRSDFDGDGVVGMADLLLMLADFGAHCEVDPPEPLSWPDVRFTELHYNPGSQQGSDSNYEFLELTNADSVAVNLAGWSLSEGLDFTFPRAVGCSPGNLWCHHCPHHLCWLGLSGLRLGAGGLNDSGNCWPFARRTAPWSSTWNTAIRGIGIPWMTRVPLWSGCSCPGLPQTRRRRSMWVARRGPSTASGSTDHDDPTAAARRRPMSSGCMIGYVAASGRTATWRNGG